MTTHSRPTQMLLSLVGLALLLPGSVCMGGERPERGDRRRRPDPAPEASGFCGRVRCVVQDVRTDRGVFVLLQVKEMLGTDDGNRATKPEALVGQRIAVMLGAPPGHEGDVPEPPAALVEQARKLEPDQTVTLRVRQRMRYAYELLAILEVDGKKADENQNRPAEQPAPPGRAAGIATRKGDDWLEVKLDGQTGTTRYALAEGEIRAVVKGLVVTNRVEIEFQPGDRPLLQQVRVLVPDQREGELTGTIQAREGTSIDVVPDTGGPIERYIPRWFGGMPSNGGGPEKEVVKALEPLRVGQRVRIKWIYDERKRLLAVGPAEEAGQPEAPAPQPAPQPHADQPAPPATASSPIDPTRLSEELERAMQQP